MCILSVFVTYVHHDTRFRECKVCHKNNLLGDDTMLLVRSEPPLIWPASYVAAAEYNFFKEIHAASFVIVTASHSSWL